MLPKGMSFEIGDWSYPCTDTSTIKHTGYTNVYIKRGDIVKSFYTKFKYEIHIASIWKNTTTIGKQVKIDTYLQASDFDTQLTDPIYRSYNIRTNRNDTYILNNLYVSYPKFTDKVISVLYNRYNNIGTVTASGVGDFTINNISDSMTITVDELFGGTSGGFEIFNTSFDTTPYSFVLIGSVDVQEDIISVKAGAYKGILTELASNGSFLNYGDYLFKTTSVDSYKWENGATGTVKNLNSRLKIGVQLLVDEHIADIGYDSIVYDIPQIWVKKYN